MFVFLRICSTYLVSLLFLQIWSPCICAERTFKFPYDMEMLCQISNLELLLLKGYIYCIKNIADLLIVGLSCCFIVVIVLGRSFPSYDLYATPPSISSAAWPSRGLRWRGLSWLMNDAIRWRGLSFFVDDCSKFSFNSLIFTSIFSTNRLNITTRFKGFSRG